MGIFDNLPKPKKQPAPLEVPTGLSDENDARRYLAQKFNSGFHCSRCDGHWEEELRQCPVCPEDYWGNAQQAPSRRKPPWQA